MTSEQAERLIEAVNRAAAALEQLAGQLAEHEQPRRPTLAALVEEPPALASYAADERDPA
mgnify:CR=1 FL=1